MIASGLARNRGVNPSSDTLSESLTFLIVLFAARARIAGGRGKLDQCNQWFSVPPRRSGSIPATNSEAAVNARQQSPARARLLPSMARMRAQSVSRAASGCQQSFDIQFVDGEGEP